MGALNRRTEIVTRELGAHKLEARAVIEDDYHHFRVTVQSDQGRVTHVISEALRNPNTLCPAAGLRLKELEGMELSTDCAAVLWATNQFEQCTHQLDLAGLAIAALGRGIRHRVFEASVPDRVDGKTRATLRRDGQAVLHWQVDGMTIAGPDPFTGQNLGAGFTKFTRQLQPDEAEAALVLRRVVFISQGRLASLNSLGRTGPVGGCWAWQPSRMNELTRIPESRRDFTGREHELTVADQGWLKSEN